MVKVKAKTERVLKTPEALTFAKKDDNNVELIIGWENTMARFLITMN
ncbi:MAG: hypothetical protein ACI92C_000304 [Neolewinella sp.]